MSGCQQQQQHARESLLGHPPLSLSLSLSPGSIDVSVPPGGGLVLLPGGKSWDGKKWGPSRACVCVCVCPRWSCIVYTEGGGGTEGQAAIFQTRYTLRKPEDGLLVYMCVCVLKSAGAGGAYERAPVSACVCVRAW